MFFANTDDNKVVCHGSSKPGKRSFGRFSRPLLEVYFQTSFRYEPKVKSLAVAEIFRYCKGFRLSYSYFCLLDQKYKRGLIKLVFEKVMSEAHYQLPLSDLCISISSGRTTVNESNGRYPLFGSTGIVGMTNTIEHDGDIVMVARVGANAGKVNFFSGRCGVTDNTLVIRVKENTIHPKFLAYFLENFDLHKLIFGSGQPLVTGGQLKKIQSPVIAYKAQLLITRSLESLDRIIGTQGTYMEKLIQLKSGLMQRLFI